MNWSMRSAPYQTSAEETYVLISQDIKGTSDNVRFTFGNGDRVMTQLANDTDLKYAEIDLCLFHLNSRIPLQLSKGVIQNFTSDGTPIMERGMIREHVQAEPDGNSLA